MIKYIVKIIFEWLITDSWISAFFCLILKEKHSAMADRTWAKEFEKYTEDIVKHPNYEGLFYERGADGKIKWVVTGKSDKGRQRRAWWNQKCVENGIPLGPGCYAKIAVILHPTKKHVCQICGKALDIRYVYPNKNTIYKINRAFDVNIEPYSLDIFEIVKWLAKFPADIERFRKIFKINSLIVNHIDSLLSYLKDNFVDRCDKGFLSPGVMSNSPDRFDGFHSDGACCRHESDTGRHKENLSRYTQDRRAYENWADGDWKQADRLMALFGKHGVSADHIGPISLGFCHRPKFHPLTKEANSTKNNRMSLNDVMTLIRDEQSGEQVVSWHSKYIWDNLKDRVTTDAAAVRLSDAMRKNLHHVLLAFSIISESGYDEFLKRYLNPQYSYFDYTFEGFDPATGKYDKVNRKRLTGKNQQNNIERYARVAFETLEEYKKVDNRKTKKWESKDVDESLALTLQYLEEDLWENADAQLRRTFKILADEASAQW